ncbi:FEKKY domain-containing protein [Taibaiella soli]|nr:hypothetical protein [Taibaiella soli]
MKSYISIFILATSLFAISASCKTKKAAQKTTVKKTEQAQSVPPTAAAARKDIKNNQVKYYSFGIAAPKPQFVAAMQSSYKISVISLGCPVNDGIMGYNSVVDSFMKAKYHKSVGDVQKESMY